MKVNEQATSKEKTVGHDTIDVVRLVLNESFLILLYAKRKSKLLM